MKTNKSKTNLEYLLKKGIIILLFLLPFYNKVYSQTGPGGVGNSINNVLWLSSDKGVYNNNSGTAASNGDNVEVWQDISGNNKDASQTDSSKRPNYYTNQLNGLPVITWTNSKGDFLQSLGVDTANNASVWAVASFFSLNSPNPGIIQGSPNSISNPVPPSSKSIGMWIEKTSEKIWGRGIQSDGTSVDIPLGTKISKDTFFIANNIYRSNSIEQYVNSTLSKSIGTFNGTLRSWSKIAIGMQAAESWNGNIAEVIVFKTELNNTQRIIIDNYLSAKYNLPLTSNKLYVQDLPANGGFEYEVAGIGQISATDFHNDAQGTSIVRINNPQGLGNNEFLFWGHNNKNTLSTDTLDMPSGVKARIERVWRVNEVNSSGASADVGNIDIIFDLSNYPGPITVTDLALLVDSDGNFSNATVISGASDLGGRKYKFSGVSAISNNSYFTIGTLNKIITPLPIELLSFDVNIINAHSCLASWTTISEVNNKNFILYKSIDGIEWIEVANINAIGNSYSETQYEFIDTKLYSGISYYKLTQEDFDGNKKQLGVRIIDNSFTNNDINIYPNFVNRELTIEFYKITESYLRFQILDASGRLLNESLLNPNLSLYKFNMSDYKQGLYYIKIIGDNHLYSYKVIKE
ncbi:MAG: T9SS type A sorting domain-containing protein [Bacteroidetes bacterium]|nr:T9SS type A sorting domain-containing protein [Bacteroidota bacterium]